MFSSVAGRHFSSRAHQFYLLTKPRVVSLIVFTAVIGMFLSVPGAVPLQALLAGTLGIALVAGAAAAMNCLVEQKIDAIMARTSRRPLPRGELTSLQTLVFAGVIGGIGLAVLHHWVNPLTMWLTAATFVGYAVIYTVILKPMTPQNIVIGGASGAMPPVLGWAAVTGEVTADALTLFLIIFAWTPPHFWALALYRKHEYAKAGVPMLPGDARRQVHAPARAALYRDSVRLLAAAFRRADERGDLSRRGGRARRRVPRVRGAHLRRLQRCAGAPHFPLFDHVLSRRSLPRCSSIITSASPSERAPRERVSAMRFVLPALLLAAALLACSGRDASKFQLTDVTGANFGKTLELTDHNGKRRTLADFKGKVVALFFGFTHCPDVCPTTMVELANVARELGADAGRLQVLFVTVDPERDTPQVLRQYVPSFYPTFLGLYGTPEETARAAKEFKIYFQKQSSPGGSYSVDHSAGTYILDTEGRLRLFAQYGAGAPALSHDIRILLAQ